MHVDTNVLYTLIKQLMAIQRERFETVLNTYLLADSNKQPKPELDQVNNSQPVIFSNFKPLSVVKQEEKSDEINQKPKPLTPK